MYGFEITEISCTANMGCAIGDTRPGGPADLSGRVQRGHKMYDMRLVGLQTPSFLRFFQHDN
jgi:hypothetical protein